MSFVSILFPLIGLLFLYYVGVIVYDSYIDSLKKNTTVGNVESEIDISSELDGFAPIEVNRKVSKNESPIDLCSGMEIEKLRSLMEQVAYGKSFAGLDNIL